MSDKELNLVNRELLAKFADTVSHKIDEHTGLLFFLNVYYSLNIGELIAILLSEEIILITYHLSSGAGV
ncbi:hypothetical protein UT300005_21020 [Clostridium sp. CTA-5]